MQKLAQIINTVFMQGNSFSFWGDYSNLPPSWALERQIQKYFLPRPLPRSIKDFSSTQQRNNLSLTALLQGMNISFELKED